MNNLYKIYNEIQRLKKNEDQQELLKQVLSIDDKTVLYNNVAFLSKVSKLFDNLEKIDPQNIQKIINNRNPEILEILLNKGAEHPEYFKNIDFSPIINSDKPIFGASFVPDPTHTNKEEVQDRHIPKQDEVRESKKNYVYQLTHDILKLTDRWNDRSDGSEALYINNDFANYLVKNEKMPKQHLSVLLDRPLDLHLINNIIRKGELSDIHLIKMFNHPSYNVQKLAAGYMVRASRPYSDELINKIKQVGEEKFASSLAYVQGYPLSTDLLLKELKNAKDDNSIEFLARRTVDRLMAKKQLHLLNNVVDEVIRTKNGNIVANLLSSIDSRAEGRGISSINLDTNRQNKIIDLLQNADSHVLKISSLGTYVKWDINNINKLHNILYQTNPRISYNWINNIIKHRNINSDHISYVYDNIKNFEYDDPHLLYRNIIDLSDNPDFLTQVAEDLKKRHQNKKIGLGQYLDLRDFILSKGGHNKEKINKIMTINFKNVGDEDLSYMAHLQIDSLSPSDAKNLIKIFANKISNKENEYSQESLISIFTNRNAPFLKDEHIDYIIRHARSNALNEFVKRFAENDKLNDNHYNYLLTLPYNSDLYNTILSSIKSDNQWDKIHNILVNSKNKKYELMYYLSKNPHLPDKLISYISKHKSPNILESLVHNPKFFKNKEAVNNVLSMINDITHNTKIKIANSVRHLSDDQVIWFFDNVHDSYIKKLITKHPSISDEALEHIYRNAPAEDESHIIAKRRLSIDPDADNEQLDNHLHAYIHPAVEKLYDLKSHVKMAGGKVNKRELPNKGQGLPTQLFDKTGHLTTESIEKYIESLPKHRYNISWDFWDEGQRHSDMPQQVLQVNITNDHMKQIREQNLQKDYRYFKELIYSPNHPVHEHTLGWARIDDSQPGHWHIDEIQSDFGQSIPMALDLMEKANQISKEEKEKKLDSYKKILNILCGPFKNINHAIFHAVHNVARKMGIDSLSMDELIDQAKQSNMRLTAHIRSSEAYHAFSNPNPHPRDYEYKAVNHWASQNNLINKDGSKASKEEFEQKWKESHKDAATVELPVPLPVHMKFTYQKLPEEHGYEQKEKRDIITGGIYSEKYIQYKKLMKSLYKKIIKIEKLIKSKDNTIKIDMIRQAMEADADKQPYAKRLKNFSAEELKNNVQTFKYPQQKYHHVIKQGNHTYHYYSSSPNPTDKPLAAIITADVDGKKYIRGAILNSLVPEHLEKLNQIVRNNNNFNYIDEPIVIDKNIHADPKWEDHESDLIHQLTPDITVFPVNPHTVTTWISFAPIYGQNKPAVVAKESLHIPKNEMLNTFNTSHREVLFRKLADKVFGLGKYIPKTATFIHPANNRIWSAMQYIPHSQKIEDFKNHPASKKNEQDYSLYKMAIMDIILGNNDRHKSNYLVDPNNNIYLIDNGLAFDYSHITTDIIPDYVRHLLDNPVPKEVHDWLMNLDEVKMAKILNHYNVPINIIQIAIKRMLDAKQWSNITKKMTYNQELNQHKTLSSLLNIIRSSRIIDPQTKEDGSNIPGNTSITKKFSPKNITPKI